MAKQSTYLTFVLLCFFAGTAPLNVKAQTKERQLSFDLYEKYYGQKPLQVNAAKERALDDLRKGFSKKAFRGYSLLYKNLTVTEYQGLLATDGHFSDLDPATRKLDQLLAEAFNRLWEIAEAYRKKEQSEKTILTPVFLKSILYYGNMEINRPNNTTRFHASCFAMPTAALNIYFIFLKQMEDAEAGNEKDELFVQACTMLKVVALQAWTQPYRNDSTDVNVVQAPRFQHHVWWVGGNGLTYRPVLAVAAMLRSIPMLDVVAEVGQKSISPTSQTTYLTSFWNEGLTADGAGWGHGKQSQVWAYPIDGMISALSIVSTFKNTPWEKKLSRENVDALMNFFRGGNWYYYKGYSLPFLYRATMAYNNIKPSVIRYEGMVNSLLKDWSESFTSEELKELTLLSKQAKNNVIEMKDYPDGMYNGTRWFYNNDDLIKKNNRYSLFINMASTRCDGLESAPPGADAYNFYNADGMTLFQRTGTEYYRIFGGWDVTATPGVTAREGMDKLTPVINWRGYNSKHNFAGAATSGGVNAVSGFIFEKGNGSATNDLGTTGSVKNEVLYDVKAYKANFIFGDYLLALGAGISNLNPSLQGSIRTTIDQTALTDELYVLHNGKKVAAKKGEQSFLVNGKPVWVIQKNKFAYTVLPGYAKKASFVCETKPTNWKKMSGWNKETVDLPATSEILRLWIDHGQRPVNDMYGYVVYLGNGIPASTLPVKVLRNDTSIQAAITLDKKIAAAVFYSAKTQLKTNEITLSVSEPCTVLIEEAQGKLKVSVCDAQMNENLSKLMVTLNGKKIGFTLPTGKDCGKPVTVVIDK